MNWFTDLAYKLNGIVSSVAIMAKSGLSGVAYIFLFSNSRLCAQTTEILIPVALLISPAGIAGVTTETQWGGGVKK